MTMDIRRIVTGHNSEGRAIAISDGAPPVNTAEKGGIRLAELWATDRTPADNSGDRETAGVKMPIPPPGGGSVFRIVEFPPESGPDADIGAETELLASKGATTPADARHPAMHKTDSIDYAVIMSGKVDLLLDDDDMTVQAGDVVVQRGTNHAWANRYDEPCRIAFVLIDADPAL